MCEFGSECFGHEVWETVQLVPLAAGWRNVYVLQDGTPHMAAAPFVLVQEMRARRYCGARDVRADAPYRTRAVSAVMAEGEIQCAHDMANYVATLAPGEPDLTPDEYVSIFGLTVRAA